MKKLVIIGGGGHAQSIMDSIQRCGEFCIIGYTDMKKTSIPLYYLGDDSILPKLKEKGVDNVAVGLGYLGKGKIRDSIYQKIKAIGFCLPIIVDPSASVSAHSEIGEGTFIGKNAVVNAGSNIGKMCIINTCAIVEHTSQIGDYTHIAIGTALCGDVSIGHHSLIGANATIIQGVSIGSEVIIGAGSIVLNNVENKKMRCGLV